MIILTRGDTLPLKFQRKDANGDVIMETPASMYLTVKRSWEDYTAVLQKSMTDMEMDEEGFWHVVIEATDTEKLPYGDYVMDVEVATDRYVCTIIKDELRLTGEATWSWNRGQ